MPTPFPPELLKTFRTMAEIVYSGESFDSVYDALCRSAVEIVDGCDHASLMTRRLDHVETVAATDETARRIDDLEKEVGEGPCLDAMDEAAPDQHICADLSTGCQWPTLAERIMAETGVRSMAGFRIRQDGEKVGALNLFSDTEGALDEHSLEQAATLTAFASVAMAALSRGDEAVTLRRGLESNREIGKAIGLLMAMHDIDDDRAFQMLAKVSQEMNVKLAQVAAQVVAHHRNRGE
jgi:GAF domain-containing protein